MNWIMTGGALTTALVAMVMAVTPVQAETHYRWLDERGAPVYSDVPPPKGIKYEVESSGSSLSRRVDADVGAVPPEVEPRVGNQFNPVNQDQPKIKKNPELCKRARDNLLTLNSVAHIRMRNDQGEFHYITDEEKAEQIKNAEETIAVHCD